MLIFKFLHIALMFSSFALIWATDILFFQAAWRGDVAGLRTIARYGMRVIPIAIALFFIGIGVGALTAIVGGFNLLAPWLLLTYGLIIAMVVLGAGIETPIMERLARKAEEEADAPEPSPELRRMMADRRPLILVAISVLLWFAVIYTMVVKPLS